MRARWPLASEVFTAREIARAAGVSAADVRALLTSGAITALDGVYLDSREAVRAVRMVRGLRTTPATERQLFRPLSRSRQMTSAPLAASGALHVAVFLLVLFSTMGVATRLSPVQRPSPLPRLVFLVRPGPGGGGGGGGMQQAPPPRRALMKGRSALKSPVPVERAVRRPAPEPPPPPRPKPEPPPEIRPVERPVEPPPPVPKPEPVPPVVAPVVSAPADTSEKAGVLSESAPTTNSQGSGTGGGSGTGSGTGIGEGTGAGIGPGSGGGTGGGPYRPGSGITAPELVHEVKPDYTEEARRRGLGGDVVLEIVVRSDGRVGTVRVVQGLGGGLDQRAADAVRQWRFRPARRLGTPVDVIVEVAVEFRLR
jgi:periplasmic protein TonB